MREGVIMMDVDHVKADVFAVVVVIDVGGDVIADDDDDGVGKVIARPSAVLRGATALP